MFEMSGSGYKSEPAKGSIINRKAFLQFKKKFLICKKEGTKMEDKNVSKGSEEYVCNECGAIVKYEDKICHNCGADVSDIEENEEIALNNQVVNQDSGFWSFKKMISTDLIKILYVLGMIGITIAGTLMLVRATNMQYGATGMALTGLAIIVLGNLLWRIICEGWILLFSILDTLVSIENKIK